VRAWVADHDGLRAEAVEAAAVSQPAPGRVELDPAAWEAAARQALAAAVERSGVPPTDWLGITVTGPGRGFVLLDAAGEPLLAVGPGDQRGAPRADALAARHALTGQLPDPGLALPALLERAGSRMLPLAAWLTWRLSGVQVTEVTAACATGMADVAARRWAGDLLGLDPALLAPVAESGTVIGELAGGWALPATLPVVTGCEVLAACALGSGGWADGVLTVVPGGLGTAALAEPVVLPGLVTAAHASPDRWAVEGPVHALQQQLGPYAVVVSCGVAGVRRITVAEAVARAGTWLVQRAVGAHGHPPGLPG
jgi:sugar (pentulose or hexulose) kinase